MCLSVCHDRQPQKNAWAERDAVSKQTRECQRNHVLDRGGADSTTGKGTLGRTCTRHPGDNHGRVQSSRPPDITYATHRRRHAAAMRAVATNSAATCNYRRRVISNIWGRTCPSHAISSRNYVENLLFSDSSMLSTERLLKCMCVDAPCFPYIFVFFHT